MSENYSCPGCGTTDKQLVAINGFFTFEDEYNNEQEIKLYACKRCSTVQVDHWKFNSFTCKGINFCNYMHDLSKCPHKHPCARKK